MIQPEVTRRLLLKRQVPGSAIRDAVEYLKSSYSSPLGENGEERNHGAVSSTSMSVLRLSVKYHYLPICQK